MDPSAAVVAILENPHHLRASVQGNAGFTHRYCVRRDPNAGDGCGGVFSGLTHKIRALVQQRAVPLARPDRVLATAVLNLAEEPAIDSLGHAFSVADVTAPATRASKARCRARGGERHGRKVHRQLDLYSSAWKWGIAHEADCATAEGRARVRASWAAVAGAAPDRCTLAIILAIEEMQWIPFASEYLVWDRCFGTRTATSVDLVVYDVPAGGIRLVELKTGYEQGRYRASRSGALALHSAGGPLLWSSEMCDHFLQIAIPFHIVSEQWGVPLAGASILRVCEAGRRVVHYDVTGPARFWGGKALAELGDLIITPEKRAARRRAPPGGWPARNKRRKQK